MSGLATARRGLRGFTRAIVSLSLILSAHSIASALPVGIRAIVLPDAEFRPFPSEHPFGPATPALSDGGLAEKWQVLSARLNADIAEMTSCRADPAQCLSSPATQLATLTDAALERDGLARIGEINRSVNLSIRFESDAAQHGVIDRWSSPLETLAAGNGDCEDYAVLKLAALRAVGIPDADLRLVILRHQIRNDDHAVAAVRVSGTWRILDNQRLLMLEDWQLTGYRATFVIDQAGVHAYQEPSIAVAGTDLVSSRSSEQEPSAQSAVETTASIAHHGL